MDTLRNYTFLPWTRQGISAEIPDVDNLGAGSGPGTERAEVSVRFKVNGQEISKQVIVLGPGEEGGGGQMRRGPNSNTFTGTVTRACGLKPPDIAGTWHTPGWNDAPPPALYMPNIRGGTSPLPCPSSR